MKIIEPLTRQDFLDGDLKSSAAKTYYKSVKETAVIYQDVQAALASAETAYYVTSELHDGPDDNPESLNWGVTSMYPLTIAGECCMTRGHFHNNQDYGEFYLCVAGSGHLLCWDGKDEVFAYHMTPGCLQYIDGRWAHRLINTGDEMFKVAACWARYSGQNYQAIEETGFPVRVFKEAGELQWRTVK